MAEVKIKINSFCSLATSPSWQSWLYNLDAETHRWFIVRLRESRGCNENRDLMKSVLERIERLPNGTVLLRQFLQKNYPHMIEGGEVRPVRSERGVVFDHYDPHLLTYPRRLILEGESLERRARSFGLGKLKYDYIILDDKAYIEYLEDQDREIADRLPIKSWKIAAYRSRMQS